MKGHFISHTEETKLKCSLAQKKRWQEGKYINRILDYNLIAEKSRSKQRKGKIINCLICNKEMYVSPSSLGSLRVKKYCSINCRTVAFSGINNPNYTGYSDKYKFKHLNLKIYKEWRKEIFKRDNYTCQMCNSRGVFLHSHHIKSYTYFPNLRYEVSNGITLCVNCHRSLHTLLGNIRRWLKLL